MSAAGTILDAIKRQRNNRKMQKWLQTKYSEKLSSFNKPSGKKFNPDFQKQMTPAQIATIKAEIRAEAKRSNILAWVYTIVVSFVIFITLYFVLR